ncbi:MAG: DUF4918 family protein [Bacteroidetes bacterium]|nr:MAG: DUF4918 family protein [Bacteroidota bacterium]
MWSKQIPAFYRKLQAPEGIPLGVKLLYPFSEPDVWPLFTAFYKKFYADVQPRFAIIGINPGRFGGGVTGIPFTDPIRLQQDCGIENSFPKKQELSSVFMYQMMAAYGGPAAFYKRFYITSYSPLGFVAQGKNLNYYDDRALAAATELFAAQCLQQQIEFGIDTSMAFCLGDGKNFSFLQRLNAKHRFFEAIVPLSHPRYVMQYKLKSLHSYIERYLQAFATIG